MLGIDRLNRTKVDGWERVYSRRYMVATRRESLSSSQRYLDVWAPRLRLWRQGAATIGGTSDLCVRRHAIACIASDQLLLNCQESERSLLLLKVSSMGL